MNWYHEHLNLCPHETLNRHISRVLLCHGNIICGFTLDATIRSYMCSCKTVFLKSTAICPIEDGFIYWRTHEFCWKSFQSSTSLSKQAASDKCANEGAELAIFTKEVFTSTWNYHAHYNQMSGKFYLGVLLGITVDLEYSFVFLP